MPLEGSNWCAIVIKPWNKKHNFRSVEAWGIDEFMWLPMLHRVQWMFETGGLYQTHEEIVEKCSLFIGAFYSMFERSGKMIRIEDIPEDWTIGSPDNYGGLVDVELYGKLFGKEPDIRKSN